MPENGLACFLLSLVAATHEESAMKIKRTALWFLVMGPLMLTMFSACILPNCTSIPPALATAKW